MVLAVVTERCVQTDLRIAFVTNLAPHYRKPLFEELARRADIEFFFSSSSHPERYLGSSIVHHKGKYPEVAMSSWRLGNQVVMPGLAARLSRSRYDVVVKCINGKLMVPWVFGITRVKRLPFVLWTGIWSHPTSGLHRVTEPFTRVLYRKSDAVVAYGAHVKRHVLKSPGVRPEKVFVAGQAVESERFAAVRDFGPRPPTVLYVGRLAPVKGVEGLITAFGRVEEPRARLRIVGSGAQRERLVAMAEGDERISFAGQLSQRDLVGELAGARCLVLPSLSGRHGKEPWGLVVNEAMHSGLPAVVSDAVGAGAGGLVIDGRNGIVFPEGDERRLAEALRMLLEDRELAQRLGRQAADDAERFSHAAMADAFIEACRFACGRAME
ncbi:MAG: glycosyltransferase family 4 protein [Solirubrobacterales bacterium]